MERQQLDVTLLVALPVSAWIEMLASALNPLIEGVALPVSAWIEILGPELGSVESPVALPVSAWIEITKLWDTKSSPSYRSHSP